MSCKALREATWIFLMSRGFILVITILAMRLPLLGQLVPRSCNFDTECFLSWWYHFDAIVYVQLALHGYSLHETVFFPLWPLLIHAVGAIFGGSVVSYYVAGLLLASIFFYFSLIVLDALLRQENFDRDVIR